MNLLLVRHGETDWNCRGRIMGARSVPLNTRGERQARQLADLLRAWSIQALYSSPILRALQTADVLSEALGIPTKPDPSLSEIAVGSWEGRYWEDLADDFARHRFYSHPEEARPPGGETLGEVQQRAVAMAHRLPAERHHENIVLVSHADVVRVLLGHYLALELKMVRKLRIDHASLSVIDIHDGLADLLFLNYSPSFGGLVPNEP